MHWWQCSSRTEWSGCGITSRDEQESTPEAKVRRRVERVISQAAAEVAETTHAVLWNADSLGEDAASGLRSASGPLAALLHEQFRQLGSEMPEFDASLAAHAMIGTLSDYLWRRVQPTATNIDRINLFCLRVGAAGQWPPSRGSPVHVRSSSTVRRLRRKSCTAERVWRS